METKKLIENICLKSGKPEQEIIEMIERKKAKYSGLLTDSGAAYLIARELGLEEEIEKDISTLRKISELQPGMQNIDLEAEILQVFSPKSFEKNGKKGTLQNILLGDDSGSIRLTIWHKDVKELEKEKIEKGTKILLKNCIVSEYKEQKQLQLAYNGKIEIKERKNKPALKIEELKEEMQNTDIIARIGKVFPEKSFNGKKIGKVCRFELYDGEKTIIATAWNDIIEELKKIEPDSLVKIEGAYTKQGIKGLELHLGWQARIIENPIEGKAEKRKETEIERTCLKEIVEGKMFETKAKIVEVYQGNLFFQVCPKCGKKLKKIETSLLCESCGQVKEAEKKMVYSIELQDGTASFKANIFGKEAEKIAKIEDKNLKAEKLLEKIRDKIIGKEIIVQAIPKTNTKNKELELNIRNVREIDEEKELEKILTGKLL